MTPHHAATQADSHRIQQLRSAYFFVLIRRQPDDDKVAVLAEHEETIAIPGHERGPFVRTAFVSVLPVDRPGCAPQAFSRGDAHRTEQTIAVNAIGYAVFNKRGPADRSQTDGSRTLPDFRDRRL